VNNVASTEDVWIPNMREIGLTSVSSIETLGASYGTAFPDNASRVKRRNGTISWWCLRSAYNTNNFHYVGNDGSSSYYYASNDYSVALGFCI